MGFSANDYTPSTGGTSKVLEPGTHLCRIVDVNLQAPSYKPQSYFVTLILEGQPEGGNFVGVARDKNNPALGNYEGKMAYVSNGPYSFDDWTPKGKDVITRDEQIFTYLMNVARNLGLDAKLKADKFEAATIEEFAKGIKKYICNVWGYFTIAGKQVWKAEYDKPNYNLFLAKYDRKPSIALEEANVLPFNEEVHIIKTEKGTPVTTNDPDDVIIDVRIEDELPE